MNTPSSLQISPIKQFLLGIVFGVGLNVIIGWLITILYTFVSAVFWDLIANNANTFGFLTLMIMLGLLVGSLVMIQKAFNNKFATVGTAVGFLSSMTLIAMQSALMMSR